MSDRKYFSSTSSSKMSDNVDTLSVLGNSEVFAVKYLPFNEIPQVGENPNDCRESPAVVVTK